jgi:hypothetical protein
MIIDELRKAPAKVQNELSDLFVTAAIAELLNGRFKEVLTKYNRSAIGLRKKFCEFWLSKSEKEIFYTIDQIILRYPRG